MAVIPDQTPSVEELVRPKIIMPYGPAGGGKTIFASTFPSPQVWLNLDEGLDSVVWAVKEGICPHGIENGRLPWLSEAIPRDARRRDGSIDAVGFMQALNKANSWLSDENVDSWSTMVVDSMTTLNALALTAGLDVSGRLDDLQKSRKGVLVGLEPFRDYNTPKSFIWQMLEELKRVSKSHRKWVVVIAHEHEVSRPPDKPMGLPTLEGIEPQMMGQQRKDILGLLDEVYYLKNWRPSASTNAEPQFRAQTVQDSVRVAKSRFGCLPAKMIPTYAELKKHVEEFYGVPLE
ncbi:MAG: AAA family ATPase [Anaerolineae bacterium]|nr:AAA family ATPase [Anaerolineae bacterium]NIN98960.1 AAA family ATPase [Anaerolineae bacterium]